jgi:hypothetical protein
MERLNLFEWYLLAENVSWDLANIWLENKKEK